MGVSTGCRRLRHPTFSKGQLVPPASSCAQMLRSWLSLHLVPSCQHESSALLAAWHHHAAIALMALMASSACCS